ncbi:hypothetical protein [Micromonospora echinospora]|uniref:hypothetical protein n=1 Tax=Micromonospora echinospora TaxID=1877 RepID=UPI003A8416DB
MGQFTKVAVGALAAVLGATLGTVPATASSLRVGGHCDSPFGIGSWREFTCSAWASGGTGDYHYSWQGLTPIVEFEVYEGPLVNGYCTADRTHGARVTVTSGTETASGDIWFDCPSVLR